MAVFLTAMSLPAATSYGFSVGGVSVTSDNCNSVTGSNITGTVKYTPSTNTLTLTNATITRSGSGNYCIYNQSNSGLTVVFVGTCTLTSNDYAGIKLQANTTLQANNGDTVRISGNTSGGEGIYMENGIKLYIKGPGMFEITSTSAHAISGGNNTTNYVYFEDRVKAYVHSYEGSVLAAARYDVSYGTVVLLNKSKSNSNPVVNNALVSTTAEIKLPHNNAEIKNNSIYYISSGEPIKNGDIMFSNNPDYWNLYDGVFYKVIDWDNKTCEVTYATSEYNTYHYEPYIRDVTTIPSYGQFTIIGIGENAFRNCTDLKGQGWRPGLTELYTGEYCLNLTYIGANAFYGCTGLTWVAPDSKDVKVTNIGTSAFQGCTGIKSVDVPYATIGASAFAGCTSLETLTLGSGCNSIGNSAFASCSKLTSVTIPNSVSSIGNSAFYGCSQMSTLTIGSGVTTIGTQAFYSCSGLTKITCNASTPPTISSNTFSSSTYNLPLSVPNSAAALAYSKANYWKNFNTIIPQSSISNVFDFYKDGIYYRKTSTNTVNVSMASGDPSYILTGPSDYLEVPQTVTCDGVTYTVTGVGDYAFQDCQVTNYIQLPPTVTSIGRMAFNGCQSDVIVTGALTYLGNYAFEYCTTSETLYLNIDSIPSHTCYGCTNLSSIRLGDKVKYIGSSAFFNCPLSYISCDPIDPPTCESAVFTTYTATVTVPAPRAIVKYKAAYPWRNFTNYRSLIWYDFVYNDLVYAITSMGTTNTVKVVGCEKTGVITVPSTVPFEGVTYNVTEIGDRAFWSYEPDNKLRAPGNSDYTSIYIPNSVTTIGSEAFGYCEGLTQITIPSSVTSIGSNAFVGCSALTKLTSNRATPPTVQSTTFNNNMYSNVTLYVPSTTAVNTYKATTYWKNFTTISALPTLNEALNVSGGDISFTSTGTYPWQTMVDGDGFCAISGNAGVHSSTSTLTATVNVPTGGAPLTFDFKAWGEGSSPIYDKCSFSVDGTSQFSYGARQNDWETYTAQLTAGSHTLTWTYTKDSSVNPAGDYFAVKNVKLNLEAYACYTSSNTTLTFYYDSQRSTRTGTTYDLNEGNNDPGWYSDGTNANVTKVIFNSSFTNARPTSTRRWFSGMKNLTSITELEYLNTTEVTNMSSMFFNCSKLTSLDLSNFNTANVTTMGYMFQKCSGLTSLNVRIFNTANVTMMGYMFEQCSGLTSLDLSNFNTARVTKMEYMFGSCTNLTTIYAGSGWTTDAVTSSSYMFKNCTKLVGGQGTTYDANHVNKAYAHIDGGTANPGYFTKLTNQFWADNVEATPGQTVTVPIYMMNDYPVTGIIVGFVKPEGEGFTLAEVTKGERLNEEATIVKSEGTVAMMVQINNVDQGDPIIENTGSGVICYLEINVPDNANGEYEFSANDYVGCYARFEGETSLQWINGAAFTITVNGSAGDVNGDGVTNISDVTALINYLLSGGTPSAAADVNGDGKISIADVTELINMLLSNN